MMMKILRIMKNLMIRVKKVARASSSKKMQVEKISQPKRSKVNGNLKKRKVTASQGPVLKLIKRHWPPFKSA